MKFKEFIQNDHIDPDHLMSTTVEESFDYLCDAAERYKLYGNNFSIKPGCVHIRNCTIALKMNRCPNNCPNYNGFIVIDKLNEKTVNEANPILCPECGSSYIAYDCHEHYVCNSCNATWV